MARCVIAGLGSLNRSDDGVGCIVARETGAALTATSIESPVDIGPVGEPLDLLGRWDHAELAVVVDATSSDVPPGTIRVIDLDSPEMEPDDSYALGASSTHGIGLLGVLQLARALGSAPQRVVVVGIEGMVFEAGNGLSPAVELAVDEATRRVLQLIQEVLC
ncbi:MAG: hydrogenase maturation protease [Acidimicrobiales bacterium]